jgi:uncharacterized membrane protein YecN with MAPEG domain
MALEITPVYLGILTLMMLVLGARVSLLRQKHRVSMGTDDRPELQRAVRAFGNFTEWLPMILVALMACEWIGAPQILLHVIGIALVAGRILHPFGLHADRTTTARTVAVLLTWLSSLATGGYLVYATIV